MINVLTDSLKMSFSARYKTFELANEYVSFWYIRSYDKPFSEKSKFYLECLQIYC
ncbi:hypothetical protein SAMN05444673_2375 [Bacillus sp. OV166]|nr:hypothetical protein SAMN05444673_2375 [Bacillus sp. OV166]